MNLKHPRSGNKVLISKISKESGATTRDVRSVLYALSIVIARELIAGRNATISELGKFSTKFRKGRICRGGTTWAPGGVRVRKARETIVHPDAYYVRFKACDSLSRIVRNNAKKVVAA